MSDEGVELWWLHHGPMIVGDPVDLPDAVPVGEHGREPFGRPIGYGLLGIYDRTENILVRRLPTHLVWLVPDLRHTRNGDDDPPIARSLVDAERPICCITPNSSLPIRAIL